MEKCEWVTSARRGNSSNLFSSFAFLEVRDVALDYFLGQRRLSMAADGKTRRAWDPARKASSGPSKGTTSFIAGSSAGLVSALALQPFEVIKTRMQAHRLRAGSLPKGMFATAGCVVREEGVRSLWAGVSASCVRTAAGAGLYFLLLERVTRELNERFPMGKDASSTAVGARTFAVGAASRSLAATLLCPVTVVKTRMEYASMSGAKYAGVTNALWTIGRNEGARGLFSGLGSTLLRDAPFSGLNLVMYTQTRAMMSAAAEAQGREMTPLDTLVAGAIAGGVRNVRHASAGRASNASAAQGCHVLREDPGGGGDARAVGGIHAENRAANPTASVDVESVRVRREKSGRDVALAVRQRGGAKRRGGSGGGGAGRRDRYSVSWNVRDR